ncbi:DNA polymerase/3'-5' exonuclease PolX, partial [Acidobacteria bacterium AH-259-L09]|nr:DNA polymerase/3'-5' exonuclease PolX [Acidobacteria bacterium AH-259-L09]
FNVARTVQEDPEKLRTISGIGEGAIKRIQEIVETGRSQEHEDLKNQIPSSLLTLLELQDLGPKKIKLFWETLNITTIDELEKAVREEKLRSLPGMGQKSEAKILKAIEDYRRIQGRFRLDDGIEITQALIEYLNSKVKVRRIAAAGSVRRRRETVGDIDILVTCHSPGEVIDAFVQHPDVREVLAKGDTKASVVIRRGLQTDLRVLEDESFGAALQYFTGSKAHNVALRERAKRMGYKISEYGLFRIVNGEKIGNGKKVAGEDEEDIYRLLNLSFIPPEIRENRGEIEKAEAGQLPDLIKLEQMRGDLHMHTKATDGRNSIEEMGDAAVKAKYEYIAITDHSKALAMTGGLDEERLLLHMEKIDQVSSRIPEIKLLKGIEVDILNEGELDLSDEVLSCLDVVIASIHSRFNLSRKEMTLRICRALENPYVNILAHPTGRLLTRREPYPLDLEQVIKTARENRVCLEINAYPERLDLNDLHCRMARDMGALISINSDSHSTEMLRYMQYGVFTARRGWLAAKDVINTYPLEKLRRVLRKEEYGV